MTEASDSTIVFTQQQRIAELAKQAPAMGFTSLNHLLNQAWLRKAFHATRTNAAPGIDGQTAADYAANLESNLQTLADRAKSGRYRAPAVRRVWIPKGTGNETRPLGVPTFEDKLLQRAVVMALQPIYEQDFYDCSYGFRPGRSAHQALQALWQQTMALNGGWLVEVDIRKFFRHAGSRPPACLASSAGSRRGAAPSHRQMVACRGPGGRRIVVPRIRDAAGWRDLPASGQHLSALRAG